MLENADVGQRRAGFLAILLEHHTESGDVGEICSTVGRNLSSESEAFFHELIEKEQSRAATGLALYELSELLGSRLVLHKQLAEGGQEEEPNYVDYYGRQVVDLCKQLDGDATAAERKRLLVDVRDHYGDVSRRKNTLAKLAGSQLFEIEHLQVGMVAPEIVGADLGGVEFKLSDYRGKVVMLDFWGDW